MLAGAWLSVPYLEIPEEYSETECAESSGIKVIVEFDESGNGPVEVFCVS